MNLARSNPELENRELVWKVSDQTTLEGPFWSKNTNELKTRVSRGVSDRRVYAWSAKGS